MHIFVARLVDGLRQTCASLGATFYSLLAFDMVLAGVTVLACVMVLAHALSLFGVGHAA